MIVGPVAEGLLMRCAPNVGYRTMAGIVEYESGWKPNAIGDNTTRTSYFPATATEATQIADRLLARGDNLDAGLSQVNSDNWSAYGLTSSTVWDPCTNVHVGSLILAGAYKGAIAKNWIGRPVRTPQDRYYEEQSALVHSLSAYNSGGYYASMGYASSVYSIALGVIGTLPIAPVRPLARPAPHRPKAGLAVTFRPSWAEATPPPRPSIVVDQHETNWSAGR